MEFEPLTQLMFAVLVVHRQAGADTPIHAIAAEIWQGQEKVAIAHYRANQLLLDCLHSNCEVTATIRTKIESTLLLRQQELEAPEWQ